MLSAASLNIISWYTDTDEFLEHSPSRGNLYYKGFSLQKIIPVFWGPPSYHNSSVIKIICCGHNRQERCNIKFRCMFKYGNFVCYYDKILNHWAKMGLGKRG